MTGLFIDLSEYLVEPIEIDTEIALRKIDEDYIYIPSPSNSGGRHLVLTNGWVRDYPSLPSTKDRA